MKKEVIVAIIIGFAIGLVITFGIYRAQKVYTSQNTAAEPTATPTPQADKAPEHAISVLSPQELSIQEQESIQITGVTSPNSYLTFVTTESEGFVQADAAGNFLLEDFTLEEGPNFITITSLSADGKKSALDLQVIYLVPQETNTSNATEDKEAADEE